MFTIMLYDNLLCLTDLMSDIREPETAGFCFASCDSDTQPVPKITLPEILGKINTAPIIASNSTIVIIFSINKPIALVCRPTYK